MLFRSSIAFNVIIMLPNLLGRNVPTLVFVPNAYFLIVWFSIQTRGLKGIQFLNKFCVSGVKPIPKDQSSFLRPVCTQLTIRLLDVDLSSRGHNNSYPQWDSNYQHSAYEAVALLIIDGKIEKVPRGIRGEKSSKNMASLRNLVSTIGALASPKMGDGTRCPEG